MTTITIATPVALSRSRTYSPVQWKGLRPRIVQLYRDEGKSLKELQVILAGEHDFWPTAAMLKKRIHKWKLDRKNKQAEMLYALRVALQRNALGKDTTFTIRGRAVKFEQIQRYFRRKGSHYSQWLASAEIATAPPSDVESHTPLLPHQKKTRQVTSMPLVFGKELRARTLTLDEVSILASLIQILSSTATMNQLEKLLYHDRAYYDSILQYAKPIANPSRLRLKTLGRFHQQYADGYQFLLDKKIDQAFTSFGIAFDLVAVLLKQVHVLFLPYVYHLVFSLRQSRGHEVFIQLFNLISKMVEERFTHMASLQSSLTIFNQLSIDDGKAVSMRVFQAICDRLHLQISVNYSAGMTLHPGIIHGTPEGAPHDYYLDSLTYSAILNLLMQHRLTHREYSDDSIPPMPSSKSKWKDLMAVDTTSPTESTYENSVDRLASHRPVVDFHDFHQHMVHLHTPASRRRSRQSKLLVGDEQDAYQTVSTDQRRHMRSIYISRRLDTPTAPPRFVKVWS